MGCRRSPEFHLPKWQSPGWGRPVTLGGVPTRSARFSKEGTPVGWSSSANEGRDTRVVENGGNRSRRKYVLGHNLGMILADFTNYTTYGSNLAQKERAWYTVRRDGKIMENRGSA
jgi:hypothetical protein